MKNPVVILLLTVHLFAYTDIIQVFRFPNLIEHYQEHHFKNKSIGFIDFLIMHYGKCNDGDTKDDKKDMNLPFKTIDLHIIGYVILVPDESIISAHFLEINDTSYYSYYNTIKLSSHKPSLFRPPNLTV